MPGGKIIRVPLKKSTPRMPARTKHSHSMVRNPRTGRLVPPSQLEKSLTESTRHMRKLAKRSVMGKGKKEFPKIIKFKEI